MKLKTMMTWLLVWLSTLGNAQVKDISQPHQSELTQNLRTPPNLLNSDIDTIIADVLRQYNGIKESGDPFSNSKDINWFDLIDLASDIDSLNVLSTDQIHYIVKWVIDSLELGDREYGTFVSKIQLDEVQKSIVTNALSSFIVGHKDVIIAFAQWKITEQELSDIFDQSLEWQSISSIDTGLTSIYNKLFLVSYVLIAIFYLAKNIKKTYKE